jgi:hypothetical protein
MCCINTTLSAFYEKKTFTTHFLLYFTEKILYNYIYQMRKSVKKGHVASPENGNLISTNHIRMLNMEKKNVNYTVEMTAKAVDLYQEGATVDQIADAIGKSVRSVRSKLVREGVYVAQPKPASAKKADEPTKKELMIQLEEVVPFPTDGLMGATKACLMAILSHYEQ